MGKYINGIIEVFKKSFNLKLWLYYLLIIIAIMVIFSLVLLVVAIPAILITLPYLTNPAKLMTDWLLLVVVYGITFVVFTIITGLIDAYSSGVLLKIAKRPLENKEINLRDSFNVPIGRVATLFLISLLIGVISFVLMIVLLLPSIIEIINILPLLETSNMAILGKMISLVTVIVLNVVLVALLFTVVSIALAPVLMLLAPVAIFENYGIINSIKRAFKLVKGNYLGSMGYIILLIVITIGASLVIAAAEQIVVFVIGMLGNVFVNQAAVLAVMIILMIGIIIVLETIFSVWLTAFIYLAIMKLYLINNKGKETVSESKVEKALDEGQAWITAHKKVPAKTKSKTVKKAVKKPAAKKVSKKTINEAIKEGKNWAKKHPRKTTAKTGKSRKK